MRLLWLDGELSSPQLLRRAYRDGRYVDALDFQPWARGAANSEMGAPARDRRGIASVGVKSTYDEQIKRFVNEIRDAWQAHEQVLAQDPRDGQTR